MTGSTKIWGMTIKAHAVDAMASRMQENGKDVDEAAGFLVRQASVSEPRTASYMIGQYIDDVKNFTAFAAACKAENKRQYRGR